MLVHHYNIICFIIQHDSCVPLGYPEDEAASLESLYYRQSNAGDLFLGYFEDSRLYGVCTFGLLIILCILRYMCLNLHLTIFSKSLFGYRMDKNQVAIIHFITWFAVC